MYLAAAAFLHFLQSSDSEDFLQYFCAYISSNTFIYSESQFNINSYWENTMR